MEHGCSVLLGVHRRKIRVVLGCGETVGPFLRGTHTLFLVAMIKEGGLRYTCVLVSVLILDETKKKKTPRGWGITWSARGELGVPR